MDIIRSFLGKGKDKRRDLKTAFALFRGVLEKNNRALEIIADMGEKLGGGYLFDIVYVRGAYSELRRRVQESIREFDLLTEGRYGMAAAFDRIDKAIGDALFDEPAAGGGASVPLAVPFGSITWELRREAGGKNYTLSRLAKSAGLNVPAGFAITCLAYEQFMSHNGLSERARNAAGAQELSGLRKAVLEGVCPPALEEAVGAALKTLAGPPAADKKTGFLAVRSSAEDEDGSCSFAGQFETVLNVPATTADVLRAYKTVIASLFSERAAAYGRQLGYPPGLMRMSVGCMAMVDAQASGAVLASGGGFLINAAWGLGPSVVEGSAGADVFRIGGDQHSLAVVEKIPGGKETMYEAGSQGGIRKIETPEDLRDDAFCLTDRQALELAGVALRIEEYAGGRPQEMEWALGRDGKFYVLQSRDIPGTSVGGGAETGPEKAGGRPARKEFEGKNKKIFAGEGHVVQEGSVSGRVFLLKKAADLDRVPEGAILVARHDSPDYILVMPRISAVITETGTPASHMASICREFKLPCVVNVRGIMHAVSEGQEVTLVADEDGAILYDGRMLPVAGTAAGRQPVHRLFEFRKNIYIMRFISPLNLVGAFGEEFSPERARTVHDVLRFMHEKSVREIIGLSGQARRKGAARRLSLSVPAGIQVIDLGGGLKAGTGEARIEDVISRPFRALLEGMTAPGAWSNAPVALGAKDFLAGMVRTGRFTAMGGEFAGGNLAVIDADYMNLGMKFGFHFNVIDSYCSANPANNHIYFRFTGGATDITKRTRRIRLLEKVLGECGFTSSAKGDLLVARLSHLPCEDIMKALGQAGRLIAFTRQLDALLEDDSSVDRYAEDFLSGGYGPP
ncbi:MAG: PEP-utilizing enzyme [Nitrospiraceae bacterium]|nr:PEP-utilizing enzyme [Nitrospiraceae bacterium]